LKSTPQGWRQFPITGIFSAKGKNMVKEIKPDQLNDMWKNARVPDDINFNVPGENKVSLDRTLAEEFRELKRNASKNLRKAYGRPTKTSRVITRSSFMNGTPSTIWKNSSAASRTSRGMLRLVKS
jgi:hypothetical protein